MPNDRPEYKPSANIEVAPLTGFPNQREPPQIAGVPCTADKPGVRCGNGSYPGEFQFGLTLTQGVKLNEGIDALVRGATADAAGQRAAYETEANKRLRDLGLYVTVELREDKGSSGRSYWYPFYVEVAGVAGPVPEQHPAVQKKGFPWGWVIGGALAALGLGYMVSGKSK